MNSTDRLVYETVRQHKIDNDGATPSLRKIAEIVGFSWSAIGVAISRLERHGSIRVQRGGRGRSNVIELIGEEMQYIPPEPLEHDG